MTNRIISLSLALVLAGQPSFAADPDVEEVDWSTFQRVNGKRGRSRAADIRLADGSGIKAVVLEIDDDGLALQPSRATKQFKESNGRAFVPRDAVRSVHFRGRTGRRGLWGFLIGAGAGTAVAGAYGASCGSGDCEGVAAGAAVLALAAGLAIGGYLVGHFSNPKFPEYRIVRP